MSATIPNGSTWKYTWKDREYNVTVTSYSTTERGYRCVHADGSVEYVQGDELSGVLAALNLPRLHQGVWVRTDGRRKRKVGSVWYVI